MVTQLAAAELAHWRSDASRAQPVVVDVREPWENALASLPQTTQLPLGQFVAGYEQLPRDQALVLLCHHGVRSQQAALFLVRQGFESVFNLRGGIEAYAREVDPSVPQY